MAAVRGIGVAVMTRTSGTGPPPALSRSAARCSTPKRCCSSMTTAPSEANSTPSWMRACVPMATSTSPAASPARMRRRSAAPTLLVSSSTRTGRAPNSDVPESGTSTSASSARMPRACCSASTSVGAMNAPWWPPCTAASSVHTATTVLPLPTSPCSNRCIGCGAARSPPISAIAARWSAVRSNGRRSRNASRSGPSVTWAMPRVVRSMCRLRWTRAIWTRSSSSSTSRRRATSLCAIDSGAWMPAKASGRVTRS